MTGPDEAHRPITQANASTIARQRWEKARAGFAAGIAQELRDTGMISNIDDMDTGAMHVLGAKTAELLISAENARGYAELLSTATRTAGWTPAVHERAEAEQSSLLDAIPPGMVMLIAGMSDGNAFDNYS